VAGYPRFGRKSPQRNRTISKFALLSFIALIWISINVACSADPVPLPDVGATPDQAITIGLTGSAADLPQLIPDIAETNITWIESNSDILYDELDAGNFDAILVHYLQPEIENENMHWFNPVAVDGVALVVHPDNPVSDLSLAQAQALFSGNIDNWSLVGGAEMPVEIVSREPGSGVRNLFNQRVMAEQRVTINAIIQPSSDAVRDYVATHPGAIGYVMMGALPRVTTEPGQAVRLLAVDGIAPTPITTANQSYSLSVPLFVISADSAEPQGLLRRLIAHLQSEEGQAQLGVRYGRVK